jgi:serine/threonine protein kinase
MTRKIIGEGAYGCVHKPSIHCENLPTPDFDYKDYVSKFMKNKDAEKELREFVVIANYDPNNEFHLGTPIKCKPELTPEIIDDIKRCKHVNQNDLINTPDVFSLLLMKYGGPDLASFCKDYIHDYLKSDKSIKSDQFWTEVHHLLKGLQFFKNNNLIHHDIKPQNILFNLDNGKLMFIDFGLMTTKDNVIEKSKKDTNHLAVFHWSYPFDTGFMNRYFYTHYKGDKHTHNNYLKKFERLIVNDSPNTTNFPIKRPDSFKLLFQYIEPDGRVPVKTKQFAYISNFFNGLRDFVKTKTYDEFLTNTANSIDIFGLGFTLQYILNCFKRNNAVDDEFYNKASALFRKMYDFNPSTRELNLENILDEYENILLQTGILTRLNKTFREHNIINQSPVPISIKKSPSQKTTITDKVATYNVVELAQFLNKRCPEDKELNPKTNRCVNKCKVGYSRNNLFKCVKTKSNIPKIKASKSFTRKLCPQDKELNPKTNRCVNKCKVGYSRNSDFKCVRTKSNIPKIKASQSVTKKVCPDTKELNPNTNRCVNKCNIGYSRNNDFKCVRTKSNNLSTNYAKVVIT